MRSIICDYIVRHGLLNQYNSPNSNPAKFRTASPPSIPVITENEIVKLYEAT